MDNTSIEVIREMQSRFGSANWQQWSAVRTPQWDYIRLNTAAPVNTVNFFVNPLGSQDPVAAQGKTLEETNVQQGGTFGQVYFVITQVRTHVLVLPKHRQPAGLGDQTDYMNLLGQYANPLLALMSAGVLRIYIGQKEYITPINRPFVSAPPGFGVDVEQIGASFDAAIAVPVGNRFVQQDNSDANVLAVTPYQWVEPSQTFAARIDFPQWNTPDFTALDDDTFPALRVNLGVILDGYVIRPSQ